MKQYFRKDHNICLYDNLPDTMKMRKNYFKYNKMFIVGEKLP